MKKVHFVPGVATHCMCGFLSRPSVQAVAMSFEASDDRTPNRGETISIVVHDWIGCTRCLDGIEEVVDGEEVTRQDCKELGLMIVPTIGYSGPGGKSAERHMDEAAEFMMYHMDEFKPFFDEIDPSHKWRDEIEKRASKRQQPPFRNEEDLSKKSSRRIDRRAELIKKLVGTDCSCGADQSEHQPGPAGEAGHGQCERTGCVQYTWVPPR